MVVIDAIYWIWNERIVISSRSSSIFFETIDFLKEETRTLVLVSISDIGQRIIRTAFRFSSLVAFGGV